MPKRKEPELTPEEQFKRFVKTAKKHEVDTSGKELETAFETIAKPKPRRSPKASSRDDSSTQ